MKVFLIVVSIMVLDLAEKETVGNKLVEIVEMPSLQACRTVAAEVEKLVLETYGTYLLYPDIVRKFETKCVEVE